MAEAQNFQGGVAIVVSQFHSNITAQLKEGAMEAWQQAEEQYMDKMGAQYASSSANQAPATSADFQLPSYFSQKPQVLHVPGTFEMPLMAQWAFEQAASAVVALGVVIQGETDHNQYICHAATRELARLQLEYGRPVGFAVLSTPNAELAQARSGGNKGNKGAEAMKAVLNMLDYGYPHDLLF